MINVLFKIYNMKIGLPIMMITFAIVLSKHNAIV